MRAEDEQFAARQRDDGHNCNGQSRRVAPWRQRMGRTFASWLTAIDSCRSRTSTGLNNSSLANSD